MSSGGGPEGYCRLCGEYSQSSTINHGGLCLACEGKCGLIPDPLSDLRRRIEKLEARIAELEKQNDCPVEHRICRIEDQLAELEKGTASPEPKQWRPMKTITIEILAKDTPGFESECCRKSYWEGFQKGVYVAKMENQSGCCCVFNEDEDEDESEVLQCCNLHANLRGAK